MKKYLLLRLLLIVTIAVLTLKCSEDNKSVNPPPPNPNELLNSTFESNGMPDTDGWTLSARPLAEIVEEAPPGGGTYSVRLTAATPEGGKAWIIIPAAADKQNYKLSFWAKTNSPSSLVYFDLLRNGQVESHNELNVRDTVWTQYSVVDTFQVVSGDSIRVIFQERLEQIILRETYFDLCKVETID